MKNIVTDFVMLLLCYCYGLLKLCNLATDWSLMLSILRLCAFFIKIKLFQVKNCIWVQYKKNTSRSFVLIIFDTF